MKRQQQQTTFENRVWSPLTEYALDHEDIVEMMEGSPEDKITVLRKIQPGQYLDIAISMRTGTDVRDTRGLQRYVDALRDAGLDIGRGDATYGFKMPLPENGKSSRQLRIFRRH